MNVQYIFMNVVLSVVVTNVSTTLLEKNTLEKTVCIIILHYFTYIIRKIYDKNSYIYFMYFYIYFILHNNIMSYTFIY